jgi:hypothetical protein
VHFWDGPEGIKNPVLPREVYSARHAPLLQSMSFLRVISLSQNSEYAASDIHTIFMNSLYIIIKLSPESIIYVL